ncbi:class I SAM-dependent methyltransferase [Streptomyces tendae]
MPEHSLSSADQAYAEVYDQMHAARASTTIVSELYAEAMGDAYPVELNASSSVDWQLLGAMVGALRMRPGERLVDLGCGTGGVSLWLARALAVSVTGVDISATAVHLASAHVRQLSLPPGRARFVVGSRLASGLPDQWADGLVCVDALGRGIDRRPALQEIRRLLKPGARAVVTASRSRLAPSPPWSEHAEATGLMLEAEQERPHEPQMWNRLYDLWIAHEKELREQLGDAQAESMLTEARISAPMLKDRIALVVTLRRPVDA